MAPREAHLCPEDEDDVQQLEDIVQLLDSADIQYWLDSGTLLGMIREGRLLDADRDIDISIRDASVEGLFRLVGEFRERGYRSVVRTVNGMPFELKLFPADPKLRAVDIKIFRIGNGYVWCPLPVRSSSYTKAELRQLLSKEGYRLRTIGERLFWMVVRKVGTGASRTVGRILGKRTIDVARAPWSVGMVLWMWRIPLEFVETLDLVPELGMWVPNKAEQYLGLRYGDWQSPVTGWDFLRDDGSIVRKNHLGIAGAESQSQSRIDESLN